MNNSSFFDCLLNEEEFQKNKIKCEPLSYEAPVNNKNKFEYKIEYNYVNEDLPREMGESYLNFHERGNENLN